MKLIMRPPKGGKTEALIRACAREGGYIVRTTREQAAGISRRARELELSIPAPLTAEEWRNGNYYPRGTGRLYFDNLDGIVQALSKVPAVMATWTADDQEESNGLGRR